MRRVGSDPITNLAVLVIISQLIIVSYATRESGAVKWVTLACAVAIAVLMVRIILERGR